jgi:hypothetical protein
MARRRSRLSWKRVAAWTLACGVVGGAVGAATASKPRSGPGRPEAVEAVLRALDGSDRATLAARLNAAGPPDAYAAPWRDELVVAGAAARDDHETLWRVATTRRGAPAAKALLLLADRGRSAEERAKAEERLRTDYPDSWANAARTPRRPP